MQDDFKKYLRSETLKVSKAVLISMIALLILFAALFLKYVKEERPTNAMKYMLIAQGVQALFLAFTVYISYKYEKFVDMLGLSIIIPTLILFCLSYMTEIFDMNTEARNV